MGNSPSSTAYSSSSSYINGVGVTSTESDSCSWYNPFCSGASANTSTYAENRNNPAFLGASLAVFAIFITLFILLSFHRNRKCTKKPKTCRRLEFLGNDRVFKYNLEDDIEMISIEASKPLFKNEEAVNVANKAYFESDQ